jgi:hypothetical protein
VINVVDLLSPAGPVERTLFPGEGDGSDGTKLEVRLQSYIDQSYDKVADIAFAEPDDAARAWALYLTHEAAYTLAISRPANENDMVPVLGSRGYQKDQRDALRAKANQYKAEYDSLESNAITASQPVNSGPQSRETPTNFAW